jgi:predicted RNA-binding Zn ribbon-like protein
MDEREKRLVGEQLEPGGRPKAPGRLAILQRFVNTWNHEFPPDWDRLGTPEKATTWLTRAKVLPRGSNVTAAGAGRLRELREAIRALAIANHELGPPPPDAITTIRREARLAPLVAEVDASGRTSLGPARPDLESAIANLMAVLHEAQLAGDWRRMKACRQCEYVFFDRSKNRSAAWCAMSICGNRTKNRAYRRRLAVTRSTRRSS